MITVSTLQTLLASLSEDNVLRINTVGNLAVLSDTGSQYYLGYIDFVDGTLHMDN